MTEPGETTEEALLHYAERQTKALESLNTYFMRFLALLAVLVLIVLIAWLSS